MIPSQRSRDERSQWTRVLYHILQLLNNKHPSPHRHPRSPSLYPRDVITTTMPLLPKHRSAAPPMCLSRRCPSLHPADTLLISPTNNPQQQEPDNLTQETAGNSDSIFIPHKAHPSNLRLLTLPEPRLHSLCLEIQEYLGVTVLFWPSITRLGTTRHPRPPFHHSVTLLISNLAHQV